MKTQVQLIFKYIGIGIIAMLLAMCDTDGGDTGGTGGTNSGPTNYDISTYTLSYEKTPQGEKKTLLPTWGKETPDATYEINHGTPAGTVTAPTIDESTGEVTIATGTTAGVYTITATGTGNYTGEKTTTLPITVATASKAALTTAINAGISVWGNEGDFNYIITSTITDMSNLFQDTVTTDNAGYQLFNGDISQWNTSVVTNMSFMFNGARKFNQPIGDWNTSKVQNMSSMFKGASKFNQDINTEIDPAGDGNGAGKTGDDRWNTNKVINMRNMFNDALSFNKPIGDWNTSAVKDMYAMFFQATLFNKKIDNWNVGAVETGNSTFMFESSGMAATPPCWYDSSGNGAIIVPRPPDC